MEWIWTALSGIVLAITFLAIYRQLRLQRSQAAIAHVAAIRTEWTSKAERYGRLAALIDLETADLLFWWTICEPFVRQDRADLGLDQVLGNFEFLAKEAGRLWIRETGSAYVTRETIGDHIDGHTAILDDSRPSSRASSRSVGQTRPSRLQASASTPPLDAKPADLATGAMPCPPPLLSDVSPARAPRPRPMTPDPAGDPSGTT